MNYAIDYNSRYGYYLRISEFLADFLNNLTDDKYDIISNKIKEINPEYKLECEGVSLGHIETLDEVEAWSSDEYPTIPSEVRAVADEIMKVIIDLAVEEKVLDNPPKTYVPEGGQDRPLVYESDAFSPQSFLCGMTGFCYFLREEDTVKEINSILKKHCVRTQCFDFEDIKGVVDNNKQVVLVDCSGFYGTREIVQKYKCFVIEGTPFNPDEI